MTASAKGESMALRSENGVPSFYTFTAFSPGRIALLYGGLLTILSFCVVVFLFNYGIREKLWSFETVSYGSISPSAASAIDNTPNPVPAKRTIARVALSDSTIHSLVGNYFSATANRWYLITREGDQLSLQIDAQEKLTLIPASDHNLYANEDLTIEFRATSGGRIDQLDIYDRGIHIVAARQ
jgi:hypothetical protein